MRILDACTHFPAGVGAVDVSMVWAGRRKLSQRAKEEKFCKMAHSALIIKNGKEHLGTFGEFSFFIRYIKHVYLNKRYLYIYIYI